MHQITRKPLFRGAVVAPVVIMVLFSFFNLSTAPDPARLAAAVHVGIVNEDQGLTFPPIKVSSRMLEGLGSRLPFQVQNFATADAARAALEQGEIAAFIVFPPAFSKQALGDDPVQAKIVTGGHLTAIESQFAAQMPQMLEMGMAAGIASLRLAFAKGQLPTGAMPAALEVERVHAPETPARAFAPFAMGFTIWLGAFVGALLLSLAVRGEPARQAAALRTAVPVVACMLGGGAFALVVAWSTGDWGLFAPVWGATLALGLPVFWLANGVFAWSIALGVVLVLPVAFYQPVIGGAQFPLAAAPDWLAALTAVVPFDRLGAGARSVILGGGTGIDWAVASGAAGIGLLLVWGRGLLSRA